MYKCFERLGNEISSWESKGLSNEKISSTTTFEYSQAPKLVYDNARIKLSFNTDLLKQDEVTYNHGPMVIIYIVYRLNSFANTSSVTLENCLFGAVKLTKNTDTDKYKYSGYSIGFDSTGSFTHPSGGYDKKFIIFGADMSSSAHDFMQGTDGTAIYAERTYSTNFTAANKNFCLILHYNGDTNYLFVNDKEIINF